MKIKFYSDTICGWCFIGHQRLFKALKKFKKDFEVVYLPFQLNPTIPTQGMSRNDYVLKKFRSNENAQLMYDNMVSEALKENLKFNLSLIKKTPNTMLSHILIDYSRRYNLQEKILFDIFFSYFVMGIDIGNTANLIKIATNHGMNKKNVKKEFDLQENKKKIYQMNKIGREMGITGVPFFIFNDKYALSGSHSVSSILEVLNKAK